MNKFETMARQQRKKILLLEGALHRLELAEVRANIKAVQDKPLITVERLLPLAGSLAPLILGKGPLSGWLRRALVAAGAGAMVVRLLRERRAMTADKVPD